MWCLDDVLPDGMVLYSTYRRGRTMVGVWAQCNVGACAVVVGIQIRCIQASTGAALHLSEVFLTKSSPKGLVYLFRQCRSTFHHRPPFVCGVHHPVVGGTWRLRGSPSSQAVTSNGFLMGNLSSQGRNE